MMHPPRFTYTRLALTLLALLLTAGTTGPAHADEPPAGGPLSVLTQGTEQTPPAPGADLALDITRSTTGGVSTALACLSTGDTPACPSAGTVALNWPGRIERARLVYSLPDLEHAPRAAHTIRVNGQAATTVQACDAAHPCAPGETFYTSVPAELVRPGDNRIEITADGLSGDILSGDRLSGADWTATDVRLVVSGRLSPTSPATESEGAAVTASTAITETFVNPYDGTLQEAVIQVPTGHDGSTPAPLVIYAHGRTGTMIDGLNHLGPATEARTWLLASPEMHGSWDGDPCYADPADCGFYQSALDKKPGAYAHASLESQYDVIGLVQYMDTHYAIDHDRIYLVGGSMGGQIATVVAAKWPDVFAAVYEFKGITDLGQWHGEIGVFDQISLEHECRVGGGPGTPSNNPFCYARRSSTSFGRNYGHVPISITHSPKDQYVRISHSYNLRDEIKTFWPGHPVTVIEDDGGCIKAPFHCLRPEGAAILDFLDDHVLDNRPDDIRITTDESKSYYWMNLVQVGGDRWSHVDVTRTGSAALLVEVEDAGTLQVGLNLGSTALPNDVRLQPGMGLPATTYLVNGAGHDYLFLYAGGYLNTTVHSTGTVSFTVSAITITLDAQPALFVAEDATKQSTLTIRVQDQNVPPKPVPDGTNVLLVTTAGVFPNGLKSYTRSTTGGQVTTTLDLGAEGRSAQVTATVHTVSASAPVSVIDPSIAVAVSPDVASILRGGRVTYEYTVHNNGDSPLSGVTVTDDNGTPGDGGDDVTVCSGLTLQAGQQAPCGSRQRVLENTTTITAAATGVHLLGGTVSDQATATVTVRMVYLPLVIK